MGGAREWSIEMAKKLALKSLRLKNFKAVRDSEDVEFTPLTVLIGNNGSGKSSLIEGLQTYQRIITHRLGQAMGTWRGFEYVVNPPIDAEDDAVERHQAVNSIEFELSGRTWSKAYRTSMTINTVPSENRTSIKSERLYIGRRKVLERNQSGDIDAFDGKDQSVTISPEMSIIAPWIFVSETAADLRQELFHDVLLLLSSVYSWQFVTLNPFAMGLPQPQQSSEERVRLKSDGSNIAEYLLDIRRRDSQAFEGIIETLQFVLPYATDLQPRLTSELERAVYLQMTEQDFKVPGWMLSTGTLRILCLLALFRHPDPPPLIVIEEIENGLDPRTIHLIVDEIQDVVESGRSQVIVTTHSPYLLDLLPLSSIVLVERIDGDTTFIRPSDDESLDAWAKEFGPGSLFTMEKLSRRGIG